MTFKILISLTFFISISLFDLFHSNSELKPVLTVTVALNIILIWIKNFVPISNPDEFSKSFIILLGLAVTIVGWFLNSYFNNVNEKNRTKLNTEQAILQSKRDLRTKFLFDAYMRLENSDHRDTVPLGHQPNNFDYVFIKYAESALTSVQLLGNDTLVKLANEYCMSGAQEKFSDLLLELRSELRHELNLPDLPNTKDFSPTVLRFYRKIGAPDMLSPEQQLDLITKIAEFDRQLLK